MKTKMNIFKQYFFAVTDPKKYNEMVKLGGGRVFLYILLLTIITITISLTGPIISYFNMGGITNVVDNYVPKFILKDGSFSTNLKINDVFDMDDFFDENYSASEAASSDGAARIRPYIIYFISKEFELIEDNYTNYSNYSGYSRYQSKQLAQDLINESSDAKFYLFVDTSVNTVADAIASNEVPITDFNVDNAIIITKNDFAFFDEDDLDDLIQNSSLITYEYDDLFEEDINLSKDDVLDTIRQILPFFYAMFIVFIILFLVFSIIGWFVAGLIYSVIALIVNSITKKRIPYGNLLKIAIYAQTTTIILKTILAYTPVPSYILTYGGYIITVVYIVLAINGIEKVTTTPYNGGYGYNSPNGYPPYQYGNQSQDNNYNQFNNNGYGYNQTNNGYNQNNNYNQTNNGYNQNSNYNQYNNDYNQNNNYNQTNNNFNQSGNNDDNSTKNNNDDWNKVN